MGIFSWFVQNWTVESVGIIGGLFVSAYAAFKDERARRIGNLIAIKEENRKIWREAFEKPALFRVLKSDPDLKNGPISEEEFLFVKQLILHLDTVYRAMRAGMFVRLSGMRADIKGFLSLPIPYGVWEKLKPFQDANFVNFIETCLGE